MKTLWKLKKIKNSLVNNKKCKFKKLKTDKLLKDLVINIKFMFKLYKNKIES